MLDWFEISLLITSIAYLCVIFSLWFGLRRLKSGENEIQYPVSVILAARNEAHQIDACLSALAAQTYPSGLIQFVLVNDRSDDATGERFREFCRTHPNSIQIDIPPDAQSDSPKKHALAQGISRATGEILLFTDADCQPQPDWIADMIRHFEPDTALVAGFSPLIDANQTLWGRIIELDSLASAVVAAGSIGLGGASTCTGRNLAYRKDIFDQMDGFATHQRSLSGDDDLLLQQVKTRKLGKIRYAVGSSCFVPARPVLKFGKFIRQRRRHFSAGKFYTRPLQMAFFVFHLSNFLLFSGAIVLFYQSRFLTGGAILLGKMIADGILLLIGARKFYHPKILTALLPWDIYYWLYNSLIGPLGFLKTVKWK